MNNTELLDIILCHMTTKSYHDNYLSGTYCTHIIDDIYMVYYLLDISNDTEPKPITEVPITYLTTEHVKELHISDKALLNKAVNNVQILFGVEIITLSDYLQSLIDYNNTTTDWLTMLKIQMMELFINKSKSLPKEAEMSIISNDLFSRGAVGILFPRILQQYCKSEGYERLYVLISNIHYCYIISADTPANYAIVKEFASSIPILHDPEPGEILSDKIYLYNSSTNELEYVTE